jgi:hypothetical protein
MDDHEALARSHRAEAELTETSSAFDAVRDAILRELTNTSPAQPEKVLKLHLAVQNLEAVRQVLMNVVAGGAIAREALAVAGLTRPN